jgi:hypothetical protein
VILQKVKIASPLASAMQEQDQWPFLPGILCIAIRQIQQEIHPYCSREMIGGLDYNVG